MVIPGALGAQNGQLEIGIDSRNGDVKAVYFVAGAVGVGHRVNGRLQPVALVGGGVGGHARIQVDDFLGLQTDVEGHRAVFHRQRAHAVHGFVGVEHAAVGVELSGVYAVRQRGSGGLGFRDGRGRGRGGGRGGFFRGDRLGRALGGGRCGRTAARQQQGSESQRCELELFHAFLTSFYTYLSGNSGRQRGRIGNPPLRRGAAARGLAALQGITSDAGRTCPAPAVLSQKPKNCPELTLRAEWVFLSRSGNRWRPRRGQRRAAGCRRSRPDLRSGCRRSQSSRRR